MEDLKDAWAAGELGNEADQAEAGTLKYLLDLNHETISDYYIVSGRKKEREQYVNQ